MRISFVALALVPVSLLFTACVTPNATPNYLGNTTQSSPNYQLKFQTNQVNFLHPMSEAGQSVAQRNQFIDEFLFQSDMQCEHFLSNPAVEQQPETRQEQSLYMSMFDTVSFLFGTKMITDTAKQAFSDDSTQGQADKATFKDALSPEIKQGVKIARSRYAQTIAAHKPASLQVYGMEALQRDMMIYDQQCSEEYGLIEINRALKAAQQQMMQPQNAPTPAINPVAIKAKVEAASKKVEEEKSETKVQESNTTMPTESEKH